MLLEAEMTSQGQSILCHVMCDKIGGLFPLFVTLWLTGKISWNYEARRDENRSTPQCFPSV